MHLTKHQKPSKFSRPLLRTTQRVTIDKKSVNFSQNRRPQKTIKMVHIAVTYTSYDCLEVF